MGGEIENLCRTKYKGPARTFNPLLITKYNYTSVGNK
jgi:hypothetical protein